MAGVIGNTTTATQIQMGGAIASSLNVLDTGTFAAGDVVTEVSIYINQITAGEAVYEIGLYDNPDLSADPDGTLVWSKQITIPISTPIGWYDTVISSEAITATNGYELGAACSRRVSGSALFFSSSNANTRSVETAAVSVLPASWVEVTTLTGNIAFTVTTEASGIALTGPDTTTVDATRTVTGTALDTATTAGLKTVGYSKTLTITPIDTVSFSQEDEIDSGIALGTPVASLPVEADVLAAGATAWQIQQWVDDGVNPEVARNITLNYLDAHTTVQAMIATANTTPGESLQATNIIAVEDDMQHSGPNVVDTVTITRAADGTLTTDKDQTISFTERYWSPSTGQASIASVTVKGSAIISLTGITRSLTRSLTRSITRAI